MNKNIEIISDHGGNPIIQNISSSDKSRLNASALTFSVRLDRNVSAMCRTCEVLGLQNYITIGDHRVDMRAAVGTHNYLNFIKYKCDVDNEEEMGVIFESIMKEYSMIPVFIEQGGEDLSSIDWKEYNDDHICFILGSEASGIPDYILRLKEKYKNSKIVSINQLGHGRSLNVGTSCGIVLYKYMESKCGG